MEWIVFDYGCVISQPPSQRVEAAFARLAGVNPDRFWEAYWKHRKPYDRGAVAAAGFWGSVLAELGHTGTEADLNTLTGLDLDAWMDLNRDTLAIVTELAEAGLPLVLLSNAPVELARRIESEAWADAFRHRFFSADLGLAKPDPEVFRTVCRKLGAEPGDLLFIDDKDENIAAATAVGIRSLRFRDAGQLRTDLKQWVRISAVAEPGS
ncbi:MAG TPA: HAD family phosphatase [Micromonosporaceae bacterium]|nr:HAD family phosphatase [Micromonosporaceae bacterium]